MRHTKRGGWLYSQPPNVPFEINRDSPQSDGLVLWMPWGGGMPGAHHHVDRVSGLVFTEGGTPVWVADGERGWSMLFDDAQNEYLQVDQSVVSDEPYTLTCWFQSDSVALTQVLISIVDKDIGGQRVFVYASGGAAGDPIVAASDGTVFGQAATTTGYTANKWHHAVGVFAADNDRRAYLDGGGKGTENTNVAVTNLDRTSIGMLRDSTPSSPMSGFITDVRIYNRALTDTEVYQLYAESWELYKPLIRRWTGWKSPITVRIPRYGFTNFQVPGIV